MIDLARLRHAVAVATEGSFSAAAELVHITQPALSRSIQTLEAQYGVVLFERGRSGAKLTLNGAEFIDIARDMIRRASSVDEQLQSVGRGRRAVVNFGVGSVSAASFLPDILTTIARPEVELRIHIGRNGALELLLRHGEIDFFLGGMHPGEGFNAAAQGFSIHELSGINVGLLVRTGHPLLDTDMGATKLSTFPVAAGAFVRDMLSPMTMKKIGLQSPSVELDDYSVLAALVRVSDHILIASSILPRVRPELGLTLLPVPVTADDMPQLALVSSAPDRLSEASRGVADAICQRIADLARAFSPP